MKKQKDDIWNQYVDLVLNCRPEERICGKLKLHQLSCFQDFISLVPRTERVPNWFVSVLDNVEECRTAEIAQVFDALETYAFNLWDFPWKKDFRRISTYSGFYKTRLEPFITEPDKLLRVLGYERTPDQELRLIRRLPSKQVSRAAFDFFLCASECRTKKSIDANKSPQDADKIHMYRQLHSGKVQVLESSSPNAVDILQPARKDDKQQNLTDFDAENKLLIIAPSDNEHYHNRLQSKSSDQSYGFQTQLETGQLLPGSTTFNPSSESKDGVPVALNTLYKHGYLDAFDSPMTTNGANLLAPSTQTSRKQRRCLSDDYWKSPLELEKFDVGSSRVGVDHLAAVLIDVDLDRLADAETRQSYKSRLERCGSSSKSPLVGDRPLTARDIQGEPFARDKETMFRFDAPYGKKNDGWTCYECKNVNSIDLRFCRNCHSLPLL